MRPEVAEAATLARASAAGAPARSTEADALLEAAAHARLATGGAIYQALALLADPGPNRLTWKLASEEIGKSEREFQQSHDDYGRARARAARAAADMESALSAAFSSGAGSSGPALLASARATLDEVARFHERRGEFFDSGVALNNIGLAFDYEGRFAESIRAYLRAQPVFARIHERTREAQVLQNIALVQSELGQFPEALESFAKVVELLEERDDPQLFADVLNNRALAEYGSRDLDAALRDYGAALEILIRLNSTRQESRSLNGIGAVYYASGDLEQAEQYFFPRPGVADRCRRSEGTHSNIARFR
ncbi:MAG: tetratricopeptide repeat protein [Gammaproteobacteria bacterium]